MTAQVVVLNRYGIALASDSAVTIQSGSRSRTYNSAEKISYSDVGPLAILQSGSDSIFGVPWQVILKRFLQTEGRAGIGSMLGGAERLRDWLNGQKDLQQGYVEQSRKMVSDHLLEIRRLVITQLRESQLDASHTTEPSEEVAACVDAVCEKYVADFVSRHSEREVDLTWLGAHADDFTGLVEWAYDDIPITERLVQQSLQLPELLTKFQILVGAQTRLAFCGYGGDDYFPSFFAATFSGVFGAGIEFYTPQPSTISPGAPVDIQPLGQTDAMFSFLFGIDPEYENLFETVIKEFTELAAAGSPEMRNTFSSRSDDFHKQLDQLREEKFLASLRDVVGTLPVDEMLRLADALVGLASLREIVRGGTTIGGPIDLARITRHGGFEWVRHK